MRHGGVPIRLNGHTRRVAPGTRVAELLGEGAIGATLNRHLVGLDTPLHHPVTLQPVPVDSPPGQEILRRTAAAMLHAVLHRRYPDIDYEVGQSLLSGYFYALHGLEPEALEPLAADLTRHLARMVEEDLPVLRQVVPVEEARARLKDRNGSKTRLLQTWPSPQVPLVKLEGWSDIQHGPYAPSTRYTRGVRVIPFPPGIVLQFAPEEPQPGQGRALLGAYRESREWSRRTGVSTVGDLNQSILEDRIPDVIRVQEGLHEKKITALADAIAERREHVRLVCVAGPSSSGKTTFVRRLQVQLRVNGIEPVVLELDDYYRNRAECPRDEEGKYDFECVDALDVSLLGQHLEALVAGREVEVPRFDFATGIRASGQAMRLLPGQVLLVEGIHGLNPALTATVPPEAKFRIFVSALTQLAIDEQNRIGTSEVRLLRRLVRDRRYRGTPAAGTLGMWGSVRRGEERWIFPFQEECDGIFNSALGYEAAVLKTFAWRYLLEVPREDPARTRAYSLLKFLELFVPVFPDQVPSNSVLREFIGGSGFTY